MTISSTIFWASFGAITYAYVGYPSLLFIVARLRPKPVRRGAYFGSVSVVLAVRDEECGIAARRDALLEQLRSARVDGEAIIVSDGSADRTAERARQGAIDSVRVIELPSHVGKAECLNRAAAIARGDVLVFADFRQRWAPDAVRRLLANFADPAVGGVSGDLCLEAAPGVAGGVGLYWRYEQLIRRLESRIGSAVGVTGAICAVRRTLFRPIPPGTVLDDCYWPLQVVMNRARVVRDDRAIAYDRLPFRAADEFRRKVRTLSGNFQLVARCPQLLVPWKNPVWLQFVSHKLLRLAVPWLLIAMLVASAANRTAFYRAATAVQLLGYLIAFYGLISPSVRMPAIIRAAASFLMLNAAAWMAFWTWISGRTTRSWSRACYALPELSIHG